MAEQQPPLHASLFTEFFEVCAHTILFMRNVYPQDAFSKHRAFGTSVRMCRHPGLIEYINKVLDGARSLISVDGVSKVVLCILDRQRIAVERYCFAVGRPQKTGSDDGVQDTEYLLRALLMRLHLINGTLPPPPPDSTFSILIYSSAEDDSRVRSFVDSPESGWVDVSDESISREQKSDGASLLLVPGKEVVTPLVSFQFDVYLHNDALRSVATTPTHHNMPSSSLSQG